MNKKLMVGLALLLMPIGATLLTACGPAEGADSAELGLEEANASYLFPRIPFSEYGLCLDGWDNDGNGLADVADPACHVLGPVRDLSVYPDPLGSNFFPDFTKIPLGGPGMPGGFRDHDQISRWMRFLTDTNGITAGIDLFAAAMDSPAVPVPVPLYPKILQGTAAQGNNNNIDGVAIPGNIFLPPIGAAIGGPVGGVGVGAEVGVGAVAETTVTGVAAAPATAQPQANVGSYNTDSFRGYRGGNVARGAANASGYQQHRPATYGNAQSNLSNLGGQSNMFHNNAAAPAQQPWARSGLNQGQGQPQGTTGNDWAATSNFGQPADWPKGNGTYSTGGNYGQANGLGQNNAWPQQAGAYGQGQQTNPWSRGGMPGLDNRMGQGGVGGGYGQANAWSQNNFAGQSLGNRFGQGGQGGFGQQSPWGNRGGFGGQQSPWGNRGGFGGQQSPWGNQGGFGGQQGAWGGQQQAGWPQAR